MRVGHCWGRVLGSCLLTALLGLHGFALDCSKAPGFNRQTGSTQIEGSTFKDMAHDQACIWTSPLRLSQNRNWTLLVPWAGATAGLMATDGATMRDYHPTATRIRDMKRFSDAGALGLIGTGALMYGVGAITHNDHARETGWLAGEAVVDGFVVNAVTQGITQRRRPDSTINPGKWFDTGSAFPSDHAMASWAVARVIAREYPGWVTKTLAYGTAAGVSTARVLAEKHSPSDVFVGSTIGFLIGNYVFNEHHPSGATNESRVDWWRMKPARSPFLPLDSEYYAMFDRLISLGYIRSAVVGQRPFSRFECARMVKEADDAMPADADDTSARILSLLKAEFGTDDNVLPSVSQPIESVYARFEGINGTPLRDSYHFGQTIYNDYGRPYWNGGNAYLGASGAASAGPVTFYARGEYQYAPGGPSYPAAALARIAAVDFTPTPLAPSNLETSRFAVIEGYAAIPIKNISISVGKQALQWGTSPDSGMLMSDNAEPLYMLRVSQISPIRLPILGQTRFDAFFGKLGGHIYPRAPWIHGQKLTFKPTQNLELGFSRTVVFAGVGHPLTFGSFWRSFSSLGDNLSALPGTSKDVGDRRGGFDFSYRLPGLRNWLTLYGDMMTDDDPSPLAAPHRSTFNPGLYLSHFPGISKLDLRLEAPTSDPPILTDSAEIRPGRFFYYNVAYRDGYTNYGVLMGNWVGRQAKAVKATSNYWFTPENVLQLSYRHSTIDPKFLEFGGSYTDARVGYSHLIKSTLKAEGFVQFERWNMPLLASSAQRNNTVSFQLTWRPK